MVSRYRIVVALGLLQAVLTGHLQAAEVTELAAANWDAFGPAGKEVDAIYGDHAHPQRPIDGRRRARRARGMPT